MDTHELDLSSSNLDAQTKTYRKIGSAVDLKTNSSCELYSVGDILSLETFIDSNNNAPKAPKGKDKASKYEQKRTFSREKGGDEGSKYDTDLPEIVEMGLHRDSKFHTHEKGGDQCQSPSEGTDPSQNVSEDLLKDPEYQSQEKRDDQGPSNNTDLTQETVNDILKDIEYYQNQKKRGNQGASTDDNPDSTHDTEQDLQKDKGHQSQKKGDDQSLSTDTNPDISHDTEITEQDLHNYLELKKHEEESNQRPQNDKFTDAAQNAEKDLPSPTRNADQDTPKDGQLQRESRAKSSGGSPEIPDKLIGRPSSSGQRPSESKPRRRKTKGSEDSQQKGDVSASEQDKQVLPEEDKQEEVLQKNLEILKNDGESSKGPREDKLESAQNTEKDLQKESELRGQEKEGDPGPVMNTDSVQNTGSTQNADQDAPKDPQLQRESNASERIRAKSSGGSPEIPDKLIGRPSSSGQRPSESKPRRRKTKGSEDSKPQGDVSDSEKDKQVVPEENKQVEDLQNNLDIIENDGESNQDPRDDKLESAQNAKKDLQNGSELRGQMKEGDQCPIIYSDSTQNADQDTLKVPQLQRESRAKSSGGSPEIQDRLIGRPSSSGQRSPSESKPRRRQPTGTEDSEQQGDTSDSERERLAELVELQEEKDKNGRGAVQDWIQDIKLTLQTTRAVITDRIYPNYNSTETGTQTDVAYIYPYYLSIVLFFPFIFLLLMFLCYATSPGTFEPIFPYMCPKR